MRSLYPFTLCVTVFFLIGTTAIFGENNAAGEGVSMTVLPVSYHEDSPRLAPVAHTLKQTLSLVLDFLPGYYIVEIEESELPDSPEADIDTVREFSRLHALGLVAFGKIGTTESGNYTIDFSVYELNSDSVVLEFEREVAALFDLFTVADELTGEIAEAALGEPVSFGSIGFRSTGYSHEYRVTLGDTQISDSPALVETVITGDHQLRIEAVRENRPSFTVFEDEVRVEEGERTHVTFSLPAYSDDERRQIMERENKLLLARMDGKPLPTDEEIPQWYRQLDEETEAHRTAAGGRTQTAKALSELYRNELSKDLNNGISAAREELENRYLNHSYAKIGSSYHSFIDPAVTDREYLSINGTILGEQVEVETNNLKKVIDDTRDRYEDVFIAISDGSTHDGHGIEFRKYSIISGIGEYRFTESQTENDGHGYFGVRSPQIIGPEFDFMNLPANTAEVTILRYDENWIVGSYYFSHRDYRIDLEGEFSFRADAIP
ncbi:MAG: hypothetical protein R6V67_02790 [Spirochaetia bacterium]